MQKSRVKGEKWKIKVKKGKKSTGKVWEKKKEKETMEDWSKEPT